MAMPFLRPDIRNVILCLVIVLVACFATEPFVEIGVNDDWSYIRSAQDLAHTGRIIYNGWAAAMLGAQLYWGALFALIFGPSHTAVRLSCIPLALLSAFLCYVIFRRSSIPPTPALLGTLTIGISPLFIPYAVTFMSDMPCLVLLLATIYAFHRADEKRLDPGDLLSFAFWLVLGTIIGAMSGTVRQINWILALIAPVLIVVRVLASRTETGTPNRRRVHLVMCATSFAAILGIAVAASWWFVHQPFAIVERVDTAIPAFFTEVAKNWGYIGNANCRFLWTFVLLTLPVVPLAPRLFWQTPIRKNLIPLIGTIVILVFLWFNFLLPPEIKFPWLVNTVTPTGLWPDVIAFTFFSLPGYLTDTFVQCLSYAVVIVASVILANTAYLLWQRVNRQNTPFSLVLCILFATFYIPIMWIKPFLPNSFGLFDRYLLPLLPGFILAVLHLGRVGNNDPLPSAPSRFASVFSILLLSLFSYYALATTSDHFRECEALIRITNRMVNAGIERRYLNAGMAYNAETQMAITKYYNDPRLTIPRDAYRAPSAIARPQYPLMTYTPDVWGVFCVTPTPVSELSSLNIAPEPVQSRYTNRRLLLYVQSDDARYRGMTADQIAASIAKVPPTKGYPGNNATSDQTKHP